MHLRITWFNVATVLLTVAVVCQTASISRHRRDTSTFEDGTQVQSWNPSLEEEAVIDTGDEAIRDKRKIKLALLGKAGAAAAAAAGTAAVGAKAALAAGAKKVLIGGAATALLGLMFGKVNSFLDQKTHYLNTLDHVNIQKNKELHIEPPKDLGINLDKIAGVVGSVINAKVKFLAPKVAFVSNFLTAKNSHGSGWNSWSSGSGGSGVAAGGGVAAGSGTAGVGGGASVSVSDGASVSAGVGGSVGGGSGGLGSLFGAFLSGGAGGSSNYGN